MRGGIWRLRTLLELLVLVGQSLELLLRIRHDGGGNDLVVGRQILKMPVQNSLTKFLHYVTPSTKTLLLTEDKAHK